MITHASQLLTKLIFLFSFSFFTISSQNYYVAENGNDNNPGTEARPWKTLKKVSNFSFATGDDVYLKRGDKFHENLLQIRWDGILNNPVIIGAFESGSTLTIGEVEDDSIDITIFPNPTANKINIKFPEDMHIETISIVDVLGKEVFTKKVESLKNTITFSPNLSSGIYV